MRELHRLDDYTFETVESFITSEVEESIHIEFKSADALGKSDGKKKEISKDIAAFANSDGGIIIYGIAEEDHKASELSFISGDEFPKEWLEQVINSSIQRVIPDLRIFPIRRTGEITESIYVVQIPSSLEAPHISRDKRFYRRYNFESVPMEEYDIRQLYGRRIKSNLFIYDCYTFTPKDNEGEAVSFEFEISVGNDGERIEKDYKVNVYLRNLKEWVSFNYPPVSNYDYTRYEEIRQVKLSSVGVIPIYPEEKVTAVRFTMLVPQIRLEELAQELEIEIMLYYYPNKKDNMNVDVRKFLAREST